MDKGSSDVGITMVKNTFQTALNDKDADRDIFRHYCLSVSSKSMPVVCIGYEAPLIAAVLRHKLGSRCPELICIGQLVPDASKALRELVVLPSFETVQSLVQARPALVGNCVLWIMLSPSVSTHDADALTLLDPQTIVARIDLMGSTCSPAFNRWLNRSHLAPAHYKSGSAEKLNVPSQYEVATIVIMEAIRDHGNRLLMLTTLVLQKGNRVRGVLMASCRSLVNFPADLRKMYRSGASRTCAACGRPALAACSGCGVAHYCDAPASRCQQLDWPSHKRWCKYPLEEVDKNKE